MPKFSEAKETPKGRYFSRHEYFLWYHLQIAEWVDPSVKYSVVVSYFEIYNDCIYDLLAESPENNQRRAALKPKEDKFGNVCCETTAH